MFTNDNEYEYYEDTHNQNGEYVQKKASQDFSARNDQDVYTPRKDNIVERREAEKNVCSFKNVLVCEPTEEREAQNIIDFIKSREPIVLNLEKTDMAISQRILDFVAGAVYAINGSMRRISGNVYLIVPDKVKVVMNEADDQ